MTSTPTTEILVHIAAASRASDDARYRTLARAYAAFEPAKRLNISVRDADNRESGCAADGATSSVTKFEKCQPTGSISHMSVASTSTGGCGGSFQFASLSFESVWDNVQSPAILRATAEPAASKSLPPHKDRLHYVSPNDYIPDSQPENECQISCRRPSVHKDDGSLTASAISSSSVVESQESGESDASVGNSRIKDTRRYASPDLSVMPVEQTGGVFEDLQSQPQPLSQRSANVQHSLQTEGLCGDDSSFESSPPLHDPNAAGSCMNASILESGHRIPCSGIDIPSSLPEEVGRAVLQKKSYSHEWRGHLESLPSSGALKHVRADSEPAEETAETRSQYLSNSSNDPSQKQASYKEEPLLKKRCPAAPSVAKAANTRDDDKPNVAGTPSGDNLHLFRTLTEPLPTSSPRWTAPGLYLDQSLRILSPEPPVACLHLDVASLITEKMAKLAQDLDITRRYRPLPLRDEKGDDDRTRNQEGEGKRELRPFERGYWRLSMSGWPATLRQQAWTFLAKYIGAGDAGWSVWCSRDPAPHTWLRLYCFAATAGHTYLILYLASQRQILATGAEWLDGSDAPVIVVPPRRKKQ
ncbi:hypothetical protein SEPCBS57363_001557 [Sporothrix epigloea]|uniref:Uncharacterized protein n=1 Tax=Sporothrix epigloea TaxID=1892477 RepID=A0ABP0DAZ4_9PEZI